MPPWTGPVPPRPGAIRFSWHQVRGNGVPLLSQLDQGRMPRAKRRRSYRRWLPKWRCSERAQSSPIWQEIVRERSFGWPAVFLRLGDTLWRWLAHDPYHPLYQASVLTWVGLRILCGQGSRSPGLRLGREHWTEYSLWYGTQRRRQCTIQAWSPCPHPHWIGALSLSLWHMVAGWVGQVMATEIRLPAHRPFCSPWGARREHWARAAHRACCLSFWAWHEESVHCHYALSLGQFRLTMTHARNMAAWRAYTGPPLPIKLLVVRGS